MDSQRVVVIGAGFAGLGAAWRLAENGFEVQLVERRSRAGGSAISESSNGFVLESRPQEICSNDHEIAALLGSLELGGELLPLRNSCSATSRNGELSVIDPRTVAGVARIPGVKLRDAFYLLRLGRLLRRYSPNLQRHAPERAACHDDRSAADFISTYFGSSVFEHWALPWLNGQASCDAYHTSRVLLLMQLVSYLQAPRLELRSGLDVVSRAVTERVPTLLNAEVASVDRLEEGGYRVVVRRDEQEVSLDAEAVVSTTGASDALALFEAELSFPERRYLENTKVLSRMVAFFATNRPFGIRPQRILIPRTENRPLETVLLQPGGTTAHAPEGRGLVAVCPESRWIEENQNQKDQHILEKLSLPLYRLLPGVLEATEFRRVFRMPDSCPQFPVGRYRELAQLRRVFEDQRRLGRRIYLAGDYLQGPMLEDALISGFRAADAVIEDRKARKRAVAA